MTGSHGHKERNDSKALLQSRALNQQQATGLLSALGPIVGDQVIHVLIAEQAPLKKSDEIPMGPVQDAKPKTTASPKIVLLYIARVLEVVMVFDFHDICL